MPDQPEIPEFTEGGVLPPGVHPTDRESIEERFVNAIPTSRTRTRIFQGFTEWQTAAAEARVTGTVQWVDGSFVESKTDPSDIDVLSLLHYDMLNELPVVAQSFIERWMRNGRAQDRYLVDSMFHAFCPPDHDYFEIWNNKRQIYKELFGHTKADNTPKGYLEILNGDVDESHIAMVRGEP